MLLSFFFPGSGSKVQSSFFRSASGYPMHVSTSHTVAAGSSRTIIPHPAGKDSGGETNLVNGCLTARTIYGRPPGSNGIDQIPEDFVAVVILKRLSEALPRLPLPRLRISTALRATSLQGR